jgi:hypothetical protein
MWMHRRQKSEVLHKTNSRAPVLVQIARQASFCYHAGIRLVCSIETGCTILPSKDREQCQWCSRFLFAGEKPLAVDEIILLDFAITY